MTSADLTSYVTFAYLASGVSYLIAYVSGAASPKISKGLLAGFIIVFIAHTSAIGFRWVESYNLGMGHAPLSNLYESLVFFAWAVALALIVVRIRFGADLIVLLGLPIVFLMMASTFLLDPNIKPLIPALQSNWLMAHVVSCFLGYAGFAVSFCAALLYLIAKASDSFGRVFPNPKLLDEIVYRSVLVGLPMLTIGIVTGAAWADYAWGSYWTWDPKETWSLITWLVYSAFVHTRLARGWHGRRTALLSVVGFLAVMFTFFGVNYLPGLHSYF
jgi:cytochrome c-type biogenesis protein CcsB